MINRRYGVKRKYTGKRKSSKRSYARKKPYKRKYTPKKKVYKKRVFNKRKNAAVKKITELSVHNGATSSSFTIGKRGRSRYGKAGWDYNLSYWMTVSNSEITGQIQVGRTILLNNLIVIGGAYEFTSASSLPITISAAASIYSLPINLYDTNPDQTNTGGVLVGAQPVGGYVKTQELVLKHVIGSSQIHNQGTTNVRLKFIVYQARQTGNITNPPAVLQDEMNKRGNWNIAGGPLVQKLTPFDVSQQSGKTLINTGSAALFLRGGDAGDQCLLAPYGTTAAPARVMKNYWAPVHEESILLAPGSSHDFRFKVGYDWVVNRMIFENAIQTVRGKTYHFCIQAEGVPITCMPYTTGGADPVPVRSFSGAQSISSSPIRLAILNRKTYYMTSVQRRTMMEYDLYSSNIPSGYVNEVGANIASAAALHVDTNDQIIEFEQENSAFPL